MCVRGEPDTHLGVCQRLEVASSGSECRDHAQSTGKLMSCFWPVEATPRSRTGSAKPSGSDWMKSRTLTPSAASSDGRQNQSKAEADVVGDCAAEEKRICRTTPKRRSFEVLLADVNAIVSMLPCWMSWPSSS